MNDRFMAASYWIFMLMMFGNGVLFGWLIDSALLVAIACVLVILGALWGLGLCVYLLVLQRRLGRGFRRPNMDARR
jgi:hypothetical protein